MDQQALTRELYGGQSGGKQSVSSLVYYLGVLRRRIWVILPVVVVAVTIGILKIATAAKIYEARTKLLVERDAPRIIPLSGGVQDATRQDADYYTTQTELILSRAVLELALAYPDVREPLEVGEEAAGTESSFLGELKRSLVAILGATPGPPEMLWERLRKKLTVQHIPESHFIEVRARSRDAAYAAAAANAVAAAYQQYHLNRQAENLSQDFVLLQKEKEREEKALLEAEQELQAFREKAQGLSASVSPEDQPVIERLMKLNEQLTSVQLKRIELASQIAVMKEAVDPARVKTLSPDERLFSIPVVQGNDVLMTVRKSLVEAEKELGVLSTTYGVEHPLYQAARAKVDLLRKQFVTTLGEIVLAQMNRLKMLEQEEAQLQKGVDEQKRIALELAKEAFTLARLQSAVDRHRTLFDAIVARMREVNVSSGLIRTNVQVVERASVPLKPVDSGCWRVIFVALGIGLFLGFGLGFIFEHLDDTVKTPEDLREKLGLPLLGFVPAMNVGGDFSAPTAKPPVRRAGRVTPKGPVSRTRRRGLFGWLRRLDPDVRLEEEMEPDQSTPQERAYRGTIMLHEPVSSMSEAYRSLRANLFYAMPADEIKVLAVTSCRPREGKTTTATNLALSIAQTGKKVLLVDADLHRPAVDLTLGVTASSGLTSVLVGEKGWKEALCRPVHNGKPVENLDLLGAGPASPNPSELLGSNAMKNFLAEVRRYYDWVVVDSPPVLFVSDATILGAMCDGVVLVVKAGLNTRSMLLRARDQLLAVHARIVGVVLNEAILSTMGRYYSTYYTYGYSRYARDYRRYAAPQGSLRAPGGRSETAGRSNATPALTRQQYRLAAIEKAALETAGVRSAQGETEQASIILEELIEVKPDLLRAWEMLIALHGQRGNRSALEECVQRLETFRETHAGVLALARGYLALGRGEREAARRFFRETCEREGGKSGPAMEALARLELLEGHPHEALSWARELIGLDPRNTSAYFLLGSAHMELGENEAAEVALRQSLEIRKTPEALGALACVLCEKDAHSEAEKLAREALQLDQKTSHAWEALGTVLMKMGRLTEAQETLEQGLQLIPHEPGLLLRLAELQSVKGDRARTRAIVAALQRKRAQLKLSHRKRLDSLAEASGRS